MPSLKSLITLLTLIPWGLKALDNILQMALESTASRKLIIFRNGTKLEILVTLLLPPRMFLVGLGVDSRAERMVNYLASKSNLDISLLTFQGFNHEGKTLLAKQVKVEGRELPLSKRPSSEELRKSLIQRSETHGIGTLYDDVRGMLKEYWLSSKQVPTHEKAWFYCSDDTTLGQ